MIIGCITVVINIILSYLLSYHFGIIGITLATSISYFISSILSIVALNLYFDEYSVDSFKVFTIKLLFATILASSFIYKFREMIHFNSIIVTLVTVSISFFIVFYFLLALMKTSELFMFSHIVLKKVLNKWK